MSKQAKTIGLVLGGLAVLWFLFMRSKPSAQAQQQKIATPGGGAVGLAGLFHKAA